jgi:glutathione S-transferase
MMLYSKPTSPYARKVRVVAMELGIGDQLSIADPPLRNASSPFWQINPSGTVPALITDDGELVLESNVICEYLNSQEPDCTLFPSTPALRWRALRLCALGDALIGSLVTRFKEGWRPEHMRDQKLIDLEVDRMRSVMDAIDRSDLLEDDLNIGHVSVGCGLSLSDRRFASEDWRKDRERMARWYEIFERRSSMVSTYAE